MRDVNVPLREVLKEAFEFELETEAQVTLSQAIELVLKSKLHFQSKPAAINRLLLRFGGSEPRLMPAFVGVG